MQDDKPPTDRPNSLAERVVGKMAARLGNAGASQQDNLAVRKNAPAAPQPPIEAAAVAAPAPVEPLEPDLHLNFNRLASFGCLTPSSGRTSLTEEMRVIKRQLLKTAFEEGNKRRTETSNIVMVTSWSPAEGKSFTSLNLAMSLSMERDYFVLLIDGDNHRHGLTDMVGMEPGQAGLVDLLVDHDLHPRDIMHRTSIPNLTFIPAGRPHAQGAELLSSKEMTVIMRDIAQRYPDRIVIIDTPPLEASTEAVVLSSHIGHAVIVVEKDRTTKRQVQQALQMLEGCPEVSCVFNMDTSGQRFSPGYGY